MEGLTIPASVLEIDAEWLTSALGFDAVSVTSVTATAMAQGTGMVGELARLEVAYDVDDPALPRRLVAKAPTRDSNVGAISRTLGLYAAEAGFYRDLASRVPVRVPRCYFNHADAASSSYLLLLEDLAPAVAEDQIKGAGRDTAEKAVRQLARLHAAFWGSPGLDRVAWLARVDGPQRVGLLSTNYPSLWPEASRRGGSRIGPAMRSLCGRLSNHLAPLASQLAQPPRTLVHGDFRLDNLLLGPSFGKDGIAVLDWQQCIKGNAASDLIYFLVGSLRPRDLRAWGDDLVRVYCDALAQFGVPGYDRERCLWDMRANFLIRLGVQVMILSGRDLEADDRIGALSRVTLERYNAYCEDTDFADIIGD